MRALIRRIADAITAPQPIVRLEVIRIVAPLAILGFMAARIVHANDWLSTSGFRVPPLDDDWRQPATLPGLAPWAAWATCVVLVGSGLATALGAFTRWAAGVFAIALVYVALADRLAAFTVSKIAPVIAIALCTSPAGARYSVDAWRRRRRGDPWSPELASWGTVRFFQVMLPAFYFSSGLCKARGDWLADPYVLWSHIHDSYQTWVSWALGNTLPPVTWTVLQGITLVFEVGAPLWILWPRTRPFALGWAIAMHAMIGLMFGPVIWFSLLMIVLNAASYAPAGWLARRLRRLE